MESSTRSIDDSSGVVEHPVKQYLLRNEQKDSVGHGKIIDIATVDPKEPFSNFNIEKSDVTNESKRRLGTIISTNEYTNCLVVLVELPDESVFFDFFTYNDSNESDNPSVELLSMCLGVDISSVHHLIGKEVSIQRGDSGWKIIEHISQRPIPHTVTRSEFLNSGVVSVLPLIGGVLIGVQTSVSILHGVIGGLISFLVVFLCLLYFFFASKREHMFAGVLSRIATPDYTGEHGKIDSDEYITDVEHGEFKGIVTFAKENDHDSGRAVLYNLGVRMTVPPLGEVIVPMPSPGINWENSVAKRFVYSISPSVIELDRQQGDLIPITLEGNQVKIDSNRLSAKQTNLKRSITEKIADKYVETVNNVFGTPVREDVYIE